MLYLRNYMIRLLIIFLFSLPMYAFSQNNDTLDNFENFIYPSENRRAPYRERNLLLVSIPGRVQVSLGFPVWLRNETKQDLSGVYFYYTLNSYWDMFDDILESHAFLSYDHSFEFFYLWILKPDNYQIEVGYVHQSNGVGGLDNLSIIDSRSWERIFAGLHLFFLEKHLHFFGRVFIPYYIVDNPNIPYVLGIYNMFLEYKWVFKEILGLAVSFQFQSGIDFTKGNFTTGITIGPFLSKESPTTIPVALRIEYFYGYGEALMWDTLKHSSFRMGLDFTLY